MPFVGVGGAAKGLRRSPLRRMKRLEVVMQDMIRSIQADRKLKQMRVCLIKLHSNLSKAFPRSSFIVVVPFLLLEVFMEWMISWVIMMLSPAFLPGIKLAWKGWMRSPRWGFCSLKFLLWFCKGCSKDQWVEVDEQFQAWRSLGWGRWEWSLG